MPEQIIQPLGIEEELIKANADLELDPKELKEKIVHQKEPEITLEILRSRTLRKKFGIKLTPYKRETAKISRNEKCPYGSGKKYKHCCL